MTQYCRYCCYLCVGDANYCSEKQQTMSDAVAKSPNRCHSFALNPIDAFGENERGYKPREPKKKQCDGDWRCRGCWKDIYSKQSVWITMNG